MATKTVCSRCGFEQELDEGKPVCIACGYELGAQSKPHTSSRGSASRPPTAGRSSRPGPKKKTKPSMSAARHPGPQSASAGAAQSGFRVASGERKLGGGWFWYVVLAIVVGAFVGAAVGVLSLLHSRDTRMPFGPYLSVGSLVAMLHAAGIAALFERLSLVLHGGL